MNPAWYMRLTLFAMVFAALGAALLGFDVGSVLRVGLLALTVALLSTLLAYFASPELLRYGLSVTWLVVVVLVAERAIAFGFNGWIAAAIWLVVNVIAVAVYGLTFGSRRMAAESQRTRDQAISGHERFVDERRRFAQGAGHGYEDAVPELAEGFGRLEQEVPEDFVAAEERLAPGIASAVRESAQVERARIVLEHAADLRAEAVVHADAMGFPVAVFDLELLNHDFLMDPQLVGHAREFDVAAEWAKSYSTVWLLRLPMALPYVASAFAIEQTRAETMDGSPTATDLTEAERLERSWQFDIREGVSTWVRDDSSWRSSEDAGDPARPDMSLLTENEECARLLMSVPDIRASALAGEAPPFVVDGDRLVASVFSTQGVGVTDVERGISFVAGLARSFPWRELEPYRVDSPEDRAARSQRFFRTYTYGQSGVQLERWADATTTRTGLRMYERTHLAIWRRPLGVSATPASVGPA